MIGWLRLVVALFAAQTLAMAAQAHEVRPAFIEITERGDGHADVLWKQPAQGTLAVALRPRIDGGLIDRAPDQSEAAGGFAIARWNNIDLHGKGLGGRQLRVEGLERTITDALVVVHLASGETVQQILTPGAPGFTIDAHAGVAVLAYLTLGIEHILTGIDHLLFVFGLILLSTTFGSLLRTITAFTVAHSITLALSALHLLRVDPQLIEALVALSILFLAVELVRKARGDGSFSPPLQECQVNSTPRCSGHAGSMSDLTLGWGWGLSTGDVLAAPPHPNPSPKGEGLSSQSLRLGLIQRKPWLIAFGFGLLHGAAFAGALREVGLPAGNIPAALFLFNVGVEIGQLIFVAAVLGIFALARRIRLPAATPAFARAAAIYAIGSFSMFWFLERLVAALTTV